MRRRNSSTTRRRRVARGRRARRNSNSPSVMAGMHRLAIGTERSRRLRLQHVIRDLPGIRWDRALLLPEPSANAAQITASLRASKKCKRSGLTARRTLSCMRAHTPGSTAATIDDGPTFTSSRISEPSSSTTSTTASTQ